jgi:hypothetical protein
MSYKITETVIATVDGATHSFEGDNFSFDEGVGMFVIEEVKGANVVTTLFNPKEVRTVTIFGTTGKKENNIVSIKK